MIKVAGRHPLKQGLKPNYFSVHDTDERVAGRHPLKQGLKPNYLLTLPDMIIRRRTASIKTRIETSALFVVRGAFASVAGRHPLKQGLKQSYRR